MTKSITGGRAIAIVTQWKDLHRIRIFTTWDKENILSKVYDGNEELNILENIYEIMYREYYVATNEYYLVTEVINVKTKNDL